MYKAKLQDAGIIGVLPEACFAVAQLPCHKDEDRFLLHEKPIPGACDVIAGIFDGHGGKSSSIYIEQNFPRVLEEELGKLTFDGAENAGASSVPSGMTPMAGATNNDFGSKVTDRYGLLDNSDDLLSPTSKAVQSVWHPKLDEALTNTFNRLDEEVNTYCTGGAAAIVVLLKIRGTTLHVKSAWAGDSRAIAVSDDGDFELSIDHKPDEERENRRVVNLLHKPQKPPTPNTMGGRLQQMLAGVKDAVTPRSWRKGGTPKNSPFGKSEGESAFGGRDSGGSSASASDASKPPSLLGARGQSPVPGTQAPCQPDPSGNAAAAAEAGGAGAGGGASVASDSGGEPDDELSFPGPSLTIKTKPDEVPQETKDQMDDEGAAMTKYGVARVVGRTGHGLAVSRSIGDKNASHAVVSDPEFKNAYFKDAQRVRIIIASDGLWDVMESEHAASESFFDYKKTSPGCATHLARTAKLLRYSQYNMYGDDDITALVLDVNNPVSVQAVKKLGGVEDPAITTGKAGGCGCCVM